MTTQIQKSHPTYANTITADDFRYAALSLLDDAFIGFMSLPELNIYVLNYMIPHIITQHTSRKTYEHLILNQHGNFIQSRPRYQTKSINEISTHPLQKLDDRADKFYNTMKTYKNIPSPPEYSIYML